jgi:nucleotide-binding universal stress UspA family protein
VRTQVSRPVQTLVRSVPSAADVRRTPETSIRTFVPVRRILCPVDFSEGSRAAVDRAVAVARATRAGITGLFVLPFAFPPTDDASSGLAPVVPDVGVVSAVAEDLEAFFHAVREAGLDLRVCVKSGDSVGQILEQAEKGEADLIVMGTHGRSGLERLVLGSVTASVLRKARCPVLTVSRPGASRMTGDATSVGPILCALEMSEPSAHTLSYALALGRSTGAAVILLHVLEGLKGAATRARRAAQVRQRLHAAALAEGVPGAPIEEMVAIGKPSREIVRLAERRRVGLIVLGAGGVHGSTTGAVVRNATVPVLTVRP